MKYFGCRFSLAPAAAAYARLSPSPSATSAQLGEIPEGSAYVSPFARCNAPGISPHSPGSLQKSPTAPNISAKALLQFQSTGATPNSAKSDVIKSLYTNAKNPTAKKLDMNGTSSGIPVAHRPSLPPPKVPASAASKASSVASGSQDSLLYMTGPGGARKGARSPATEDLVKKMRMVKKLAEIFVLN